MKKFYHAFFLLNVFYGIFTFVNILFLSQFNSFSIPLMIGISIFYITISVLYYKKIGDVTNSDILLLSIYALFLIAFIIFSIIYQSNNTRTYSMLYFSKLVILPSIVYTLYSVFGRD